MVCDSSLELIVNWLLCFQEFCKVFQFQPPVAWSLSWDYFTPCRSGNWQDYKSGTPLSSRLPCVLWAWSLSSVRLFATPWTVARYASLHGDSPGKNTGVVAMFSSRDLPNPGIKPRLPALQADSLPNEPSGEAPKGC